MFKTIEFIIETELSNEELIDIFDNANLEDFKIKVEEIRVKGSANSLIKGISYENDKL
ncbi:unnamed protein product [marine sediment metagenome]|uniref:Uncharacterized protein n=1 Tax=marine sediment metagenome TaxID=412755 RepID=X1CWT2_9ZZZZ